MLDQVRFLILGGAPFVGKTAFALQTAYHWAGTYKVGFFSFDTATDKLLNKLISGFVGIPMDRIETNQLDQKEMDMVCQASEAIKKRNLDLIPAAGMTVSDIRAKIIECGYKIVIVDYLQIVASRGSDQYERVTNASIGLHYLTQSLGVTVLTLAQHFGTDKTLQLCKSDFCVLGQVHQLADVIMMLQLEKRSRPSGPRKLYITKNKEGELFQMLLRFDGAHQIFSKGGPLDAAVAEAKETKRRFKSNPVDPQIPETPVPGQMTVLPDNTEVPFH